MRRLTALLLTAALATPLAAQTPHSGVDVLELMRAHYAGTWYRTLTFNQTTTIFRGDSSVVQPWHESLLFVPGRGALLRIDNGNPADGNGSVSTWDSTWSMRAGQPGRTSGNGNPFLGLIENVYLQPAATTAHQLEPLDFDMTRVAESTLDGRPVWTVGATSAGDTTSAQFWIDKDRLVVVRIILPNGTRPPLDIHLEKLVPTGGGWLATKVSMYSGGKPRQIEEYFDWKTGVNLDPGLFAPATWTTATHWFRP